MKELRKKRILYFSMAVIIFLTMLFSLCLVINHSAYDCNRTDCHSCYAIHSSEKIIKLVGFALAAFAFTAYLYKKFLAKVYIEYNDKKSASLFELKVRLNN